jgi:hypothetical protein
MRNFQFWRKKITGLKVVKGGGGGCNRSFGCEISEKCLGLEICFWFNQEQYPQKLCMKNILAKHFEDQDGIWK